MSRFGLYVSLIASMLVGCASTQITERVAVNAAKTASQADALVKQARPDTIPLLVKKSDSVWIASSTIEIASASKLPEKFKKPINYEDTASLMEAAEFISKQTGIPTKLARDLTGGATASGSISASTPLQISYKSNSLTGLLDVLAARFGVSWKYEDGVIQFFWMETRTFVLNAIPGASTLQATVSNQSTSSGSSSSGTATNSATGGASQNTTVTSNLSVWTSVKDAIKSTLSTNGKVEVAESTGIVTVTDTPEILNRVAAIIDEQNAVLGLQAFFNVKVIAVSKSDYDEYGINWNAVFNQTAGNFGFTLKNAWPNSTATSNLDLKILSSATNKLLAPWAGSDAMISALSKEGNVTLLTSANTWTTNNQPVPVQVVKQKGYLQSVSSTTTTNVGTTTTLTPGTVTTGFSMNLLPHILENGKIFLQYSIDISTLTDLVTVSSGGNSIQTPEVDTRNFLQRVSLNSGETLVISGFEQNTDSINRSGIGDAGASWFGGGKKASHSRDVIVVVITPIVSQGK